MPLVAYTQVHTGTVGEGVHSACGVDVHFMQSGMGTMHLVVYTQVRSEGGGGGFIEGLQIA